VPLSRAKTHPLGGHSPLCPFSSAPGGARSSVPANFCGRRGRGPSHCTIQGGAQSSVPQAGLPVPLSRARTHPLGGAQSSAPANPCLRACQFLRTARTPSLPFHHSGGPQSPVPQAGLPVPLCRAKTYPLGGAPCSVPANLETARTRSLPFHPLRGALSSAPANPCLRACQFCGPRGRRPSRFTGRGDAVLAGPGSCGFGVVGGVGRVGWGVWGVQKRDRVVPGGTESGQADGFGTGAGRRGGVGKTGVLGVGWVGLAGWHWDCLRGRCGCSRQ
jgi:hypothetical protein